MRSRFWRTGAAALVLAGLGAYVYFVDSKRPDTPADVKPKEKVFALDKTKVQSLELRPAAGDPVRVAKDGKVWRITAPQPAPADQQEVDTLLAALEGLEIDEVAAETAPRLSEFGLEPPHTTVTVTQQGAPAPLALQVGGKTPDGASVYAKLPQQPRVFTVAAFAASALEKKPFELRDRDVLAVKRDDVKAIDVTGPEGAYTLTRDGAGEWGFTRPLQTRAGRWPVDALLGSLEGLRMESVAAEQAADLKPFGLVTPARSVVITLASGTTRTLQIGNGAGDKLVYAREAASPLVAVVPGAIVDDLAKGMGELRAKRLLDVSVYEVDGLQIEQAGTKRVLARTTTKAEDGLDAYHWKRTALDARDYGANTVQDALFLVGGVEVGAFEDAPRPAASYGLDAPALRVTLQMTGKPSAWFEVGTKDGAYYARRADDQAVLKLDPAKAAELVKAFAGL
jgi:hypothetical protein